MPSTIFRNVLKVEFKAIKSAVKETACSFTGTISNAKAKRISLFYSNLKNMSLFSTLVVRKRVALPLKTRKFQCV
jgi:hypothetical protein